VVADHGISGVATRLCERPEGKPLFDILRAGDVLVVRWIDRLGRSYQDVTDTIREFIRRQIRIETVISASATDKN
jgi:DNA invertase Pin-like site-specific DNA recombinase